MGKKKKTIIDLQTGVSLLIGLVILGGLGWLVIKVDGLGNDVTKFQTIAEENKERMERIGNNIPQIKSVIASMQIEKNLGNALIAYNPKRDGNGKWTSEFKIADLDKSELTTYTVAMKGKDDNLLMMASSGLIWNCNDAPRVSLSDYETTTNSYFAIQSVDKKNSWFLSCSTDDISSLLDSNSVAKRKVDFVLANKSLEELIDSLKVQ